MKQRQNLQEALQALAKKLRNQDAKRSILEKQPLSVDVWLENYPVEELKHWATLCTNAKLAYDLRTSPLAKSMEENDV